SDVFIALGGVVSTLFIIRQISYLPFSGLLSTFNPWMALGILSFGIISKLFLLEELFKEIIRVLNGFKNNLVNWSLKSRKNKWRVTLGGLVIVLFLSRFFISDGTVKIILTTISLITLSSVFLLDFNEIDQLRSSRKVVSTFISIILFSGIFRFSSDYQDIGNYILGVALLVTSVDRTKLSRIIKKVYQFFIAFLINLSSTLVEIIKSTGQLIKNNYILFSRGFSLIVGTSILLVPSTTKFMIGSFSIVILDLIGWIFVIISLMPTGIRLWKNYSKLIYLSIKHSVVFVYSKSSSILTSASTWIFRNNRTILRFFETAIALILIYAGPENYSLNYVLGVSLLSIIYRKYIILALNWSIKRLRGFLTYFVSEYSRSTGYIAILSMLITLSIKDRNPSLAIFMVLFTSISLSLGWNFAIFRFLDKVINLFIFIFDITKKFLTSIIMILYNNTTY
ncbi:MAG: hypothetical protein ACC656_09655, partial [Candidatus Heimdallarchaeota archaeon]